MVSTPNYFNNMWLDCLSEKQLLDTVGTIKLKSNFGLATGNLTKEISFKEWISDINRESDDTFYFMHKNTKFYIEYQKGRTMTIGACSSNRNYSESLHLSWIREIVDPVIEKKRDLKYNYVKYFLHNPKEENITLLLRRFAVDYIKDYTWEKDLVICIKSNKVLFVEFLEYQVKVILHGKTSFEQLHKLFGDNWQHTDNLISKLKDLIKAIYDIKPWLDEGVK